MTTADFKVKDNISTGSKGQVTKELDHLIKVDEAGRHII
jgi:hypothetical protein